MTTTGSTRKLRVFLCHSSGDKPAVRELYQKLLKENIDPWLDEEKLMGGQDWDLEIRRAVRESDAIVVCLSQGSVTKAGYVQKEIKIALDVADMQPEGAIFIIPLRLEDCPVPDRLSKWQWVNNFQGGGFERLVKALQMRASSLAGVQPIIVPGILAPGERRINPKDGKEFVCIQAGEFLYGEDKNLVYLPEYWIAKTPVTYAEYARFVVKARQKPPEGWKSKSPPPGLADHPMITFSFQEAEAYAKWAGERLPTEQEWEKAARGTDGREYPWGNEWYEGLCNLRERFMGVTTPVDKYSPKGDSPYGCVDMVGNAMEWTASEWEPGSKVPVLRGGQFYVGDREVRCATRVRYDPGYRYWGIGFRVVLSPL